MRHRRCVTIMRSHDLSYQNKEFHYSLDGLQGGVLQWINAHRSMRDPCVSVISGVLIEVCREVRLTGNIDFGQSLSLRDIRARAVVLKPANPVQTAAGTLGVTPLVLIDIFTEEGVIGRSYVRCYAPEALGPLAALIRNLAPILSGEKAAPLVVERK